MKLLLSSPPILFTKPIIGIWLIFLVNFPKMIKIIFKTTKITKPLKKYKMYWQSALPNKKPRAASVSMVIKLKTSLDKIPFKKLGICKLVRTVAIASSWFVIGIGVLNAVSFIEIKKLLNALVKELPIPVLKIKLPNGFAKRRLAIRTKIPEAKEKIDLSNP